jgi:channel protein (hemolysin III family)
MPEMQETLSSMSHLAGAVAFSGLGVALVRRGRGHFWRMASLAAFALSSVLLLSVSGVYHMASPDGASREILQRLDHAAIFALIAGTFTPVHAILFRGVWRWGMLAGIWTVAIAGIVLKTVYFDAIPEWVGLAIYLAFGWIGVFSWTALARRFGMRFARPALWGALGYTLGAVVDFLRWPVLVPGVLGAHELFHLAVLAGVAFHWHFIFNFATHEPHAAAL